MKEFLLKKATPDTSRQIDPVTALEERFKAIEIIADPAERLLALNDFSQECEKRFRETECSRINKFFGVSIPSGIVIGGISIAAFGPPGIILGACTMFFALPLSQTENQDMKNMWALKKAADAKCETLIKTEDLKDLAASPAFEIAAMQFPLLKERFQLAAQKAAFLAKSEDKTLSPPSKPDNGLRL